jgi:ABC-type branched-subunit amino acid transport system substrate-binding protein
MYLPMFHRSIIVFFLGILFFSPEVAQPAPIALNSVDRGKQIYLSGKGSSPIFAFLSGPRIKAPAANFPCINCHKEDGLGSREGGILVPDITFSHLTQEEGGNRGTSRIHPPYEKESIKRAIQSGVDPAGNPLNSTMPHYIMEDPDLEDLIAYLKVIGNVQAPGISKDEVKVGIILFRGGSLGEAGKMVKTLINSYFEEINRNGGIFGRSLVLEPFYIDPADKKLSYRKFAEMLNTQPVFCFISNMGLEHDGPFNTLLRQKDIPVLGPINITPHNVSFSSTKNIFYFLPSIYDQARILVDYYHLENKNPTHNAALIYMESQPSQDGRDGGIDQIKKYERKFSVVENLSKEGNDFKSLVKNLKHSGVETVFLFAGARELAQLTFEAEKQHWSPVLLGTMDLMGNPMSVKAEKVFGKLILSSTSPLRPLKTKGFEKLIALGKKENILGKFTAFQTIALSSVFLLERGLKDIGRTVTRQKLVEQLESLWKFETGLTPPLSFNENKHSGSLTATILQAGLKDGKLVSTISSLEPK